jgi:signal transduction histidine kinase/DNA-binding response OmpR family regulator
MHYTFMRTISQLWRDFILKGTTPEDDFFLKTRIKILNVALGFAIFFVFPFFAIYYISTGLNAYWVPYGFSVIFITLAFYLNRTRRHLLAMGIAVVSALAGTFGVVFQSDVQIAAPYNLLVAGIVAYCTITAPVWRNTVTIMMLGGFCYTNYYQTKYLPFSDNEYFMVAVFLLFIMLVLQLFVKEYDVYQRIISDKNLQLQHQNEQLEMQNQTIEQQAEALRALDESKNHFFENISHEFRTPLTLLLGGIRQAAEEATTPKMQQLLHIADKHGLMLQQLINQLLDIARLAEGQVTPTFSSLDIVKFLRGVMLSFESLATQKKLQWSFHSEIETLEMPFDTEMVMKICNNLLSNALRFTPEGGHVSMRVYVQATYLCFDVADTGIGIPPDKLPHIFDRFYKVDTSMYSRQGGTGIGLALVKALIALHQGKIQVKSQLGAGTLFSVSLPQTQFAHVAAEAQEIAIAPSAILAPSAPLPHKAPQGQKPLLLLVEDNEDLHYLISQYLEDTYEIIDAYDGEEGVQQAIALIPDIIISDVMMPKMSGYMLCQTLKQDERTSHIPIVLLTAKTSQADRMQGWEMRADDYLPKPFEHKELLARINNLVALRKQLRQRYAGEAPPAALLAQHPKDKAFLEKCEAVIQVHFAKASFSADDFAEEMALSQRQLNRKLQALTDGGISQFIQAFRLDKAEKMLRNTDKLVGEIAHEVGFGSSAYFVKCFREKFGKTPKEYQDGLVKY